MIYRIYPLAISTPSWQIFQKVCQENFDFSPTRPLDDSNISLQSPSAFFLALDDIFTGDDSSNRILDHIFVNFLAIIDEEGLTQCFDILSPIVIRFRSYENKKLVLLTGSIRLWAERIGIGCKDYCPKIFRRMLNEVYGYLVAGGYGEVFADYKQNFLADETFTLT